MLIKKKISLLIIGVFFATILGACREEPSALEEDTTNNAQGTMLAGQEAPEHVGVLKSVKSQEEVVITIEGKDVIYRLSEEALSQIKEFELGDEVTFTTFFIGDGKATIDKFQEK